MVSLLLLLSPFSRIPLCVTHRQQPTRLPHPWDSPGKNTGVGCHFLLQCMKVKSESEVAQLCLILSDLMDCSLPGSSIHGIFQARVLEWGAIAFSRWWVWTWIYGHEFEQAPGDSEGQGSLESCSVWDHKESDMPEQLNNNKRNFKAVKLYTINMVDACHYIFVQTHRMYSTKNDS